MERKWRKVSGEGREGDDLRLVKPNCFLRQISPDTKMAGSLVKAGNRGIIPLPPPPQGFLVHLPPNPPHEASGRGGASRGGGEEGSTCHTEQPLQLGPMQVRRAGSGARHCPSRPEKSS